MSRSYMSASLRRLVYERANGCCEYCQIPESATFTPHEVDHIIAEKHGGNTVESNLALSCTLCNKYKGSDIASIDPLTGHVTPLYNPRQQRWSDHFQMESADIRALTDIGRVTVRLLQINRIERIQERQLLIEAGILSINGES